jgi:hypothetical protein
MTSNFISAKCAKRRSLRRFNRELTIDEVMSNIRQASNIGESSFRCWFSEESKLTLEDAGYHVLWWVDSHYAIVSWFDVVVE